MSESRVGIPSKGGKELKEVGLGSVLDNRGWGVSREAGTWEGYK